MSGRYESRGRARNDANVMFVRIRLALPPGAAVAKGAVAAPQRKGPSRRLCG
jgi:hypothetical protein